MPVAVQDLTRIQREAEGFHACIMTMHAKTNANCISAFQHFSIQRAGERETLELSVRADISDSFYFLFTVRTATSEETKSSLLTFPSFYTSTNLMLLLPFSSSAPISAQGNVLNFVQHLSLSVLRIVVPWQYSSS